MRNVKKLLSMALVVALSVSCMAGCGKAGGDDKNKGGEKNIEISYWNAGMGSEWLDNVIEAFEAKYPEYHVHYTSSAAQESYKAAYGMPGADTVDLYMGTFQGQTDYLEPLDDVLDTTVEGESKSIRDKFDLDYLALEMNGDKCYSTSIGGGLIGVVYNKEMFDKAGVSQLPRTTNELALVASSFTDNGTPAFCHFKTLGYWHWLLECWATQYDGLDTYMSNLYTNPSKESLTSKDGRYEALKVLEKLITPESTLQGSNTASHIEIQTRFLEEKCAMMVNGSWLSNEMPDNKSMDKFTMMKTPVISSITEKLTTIKGEADLRNVIGAIDKVTDGEESIDTYKDGDGYVVNGKTISAADWDYVQAARNSYPSTYLGNVAFVPNYSDCIEGAKLFLTFLYSDEGYKIYTDTTHVALPMSMDQGSVEIEGWNSFEKNQAELMNIVEKTVSRDVKSANRIYKDGGADVLANYNFVAPLCTNNAADKKNADEIWSEITNTIKDEYDDWVANVK